MSTERQLLLSFNLRLDAIIILTLDVLHISQRPAKETESDMKGIRETNRATLSYQAIKDSN